jgi:hypothetical protein
MTFRQSVGIGWIAAMVLVAPLHAQSGDKYSVRLGRIPVANAREGATITGKGAAAATLSGSRLTISGSFDGLSSPASVARLHRGAAKGARGPVLGDLTVSKGPSGTFSGTIDLKPEDLADLKLGKLYVQIHSEKGLAPDGSNLWGWLLR